MRKQILPIILAVISSLSVVSAKADINEPFDFNYTINGKKLRPIAVFNDGKATYIQVAYNPSLVKLINVNSSNLNIRGPYIVLNGMPSKIDGTVNGEEFTIKFNGAQPDAISDEPNRENGDLAQNTFTGTFGRIAFLNGHPPDVGIINPVPSQLQLKEVLKALAPHGWSGSADRSINTTQETSISSQKGESWVVVLNRLMLSQNLWVELDSQKKSLFIRDTPPKGYSVVLETQSQPRKTMDVTVGDLPRSFDYQPLEFDTKFTNTSLTQVNLSRISRRNGVLILTVINPKKPMRFLDQSTNQEITAQITDGGASYLINSNNSIRVSSVDGNAIEIQPILAATALVSPDNPHGLISVTERDGVTEFQFKQKNDQLNILRDETPIPGNWVASSLNVHDRSKTWTVRSPHAMYAIDMIDKTSYRWRSIPN